jgi:hypothetical protein
MPAVLLARAARRRWLPSTTASARSSLGRGTSARTRSQTAGSSSCASACRARRATVGGSARPADACAAGGRRAAGGADTCTTAVDSSHEAQAGSGGASASAGGAKSQARQVRAFGFWVWRGQPEASPGAALTPCRPRLDPGDAEQRGQLVDQELRVRRLQVRAAARAPPAARGRPRPLDTLWPSRPPARARTGWAALTRTLLCGSRPSNSVAPQAVLPAPALPGGAPSWRPADPQSGPDTFRRQAGAFRQVPTTSGQGITCAMSLTASSSSWRTGCKTAGQSSCEYSMHRTAAGYSSSSSGREEKGPTSLGCSR